MKLSKIKKFCRKTWNNLPRQVRKHYLKEKATVSFINYCFTILLEFDKDLGTVDYEVLNLIHEYLFGTKLLFLNSKEMQQ